MKSLDINGHKGQLLKGNVQFEQSGSTVYCDEAEYDPTDETLRGIGGVKIVNTGGSVVTGNRLFYDNKTHVAFVEGKVELKDESMKLSTPWLRYNTLTKLGWYGAGGKIIDKETQLTSNRGSYDPSKHQLFFQGNVKLITPDYVIQTDTLQYNTQEKKANFMSFTQINTDEDLILFEGGYYFTEEKNGFFHTKFAYSSPGKTLIADSAWVNQKAKYGITKGHVWSIDSAEMFQIWGNQGFYRDDIGLSMVYPNAKGIQTKSKDTLFIAADTLENSRRPISGKQQTRALNKVKIMQKQTRISANRMIYTSEDSTFRLRENPVIWDSSSRLSGDSVNLVIKNGKMREGELFPNAFIALQEDSTHFSQIQGDYIHYFLNSNQRIDKTQVFRKGKALYYIKEQDTINSAFTVDCTNMEFRFNEGKISTVHFYVEPKGKIYPLQELSDSETKLSRFKWNIEDKPTLKDFQTPFPVKVPVKKYKIKELPASKSKDSKDSKKRKWFGNS
jgi:lipopolysaccharide export system protein LptA